MDNFDVTAEDFYTIRPSMRTKKHLNHLLDKARQEGAKKALQKHKDFSAGGRFGIDAVASWCEKNLYHRVNDHTLRHKVTNEIVTIKSLIEGIRSCKNHGLFKEL